jgi:cytochrome c oxidase assembly protein subunit 15
VGTSSPAGKGELFGIIALPCPARQNRRRRSIRATICRKNSTEIAANFPYLLAQPNMTDLATLPLADPSPLPARQRAMARWLFVVAAMIFVMTIIGALTRLTESGLSIVEWKPLTGWIPPLSPEAWQSEFAKYQQSPEYQLVNKGMSLAQFQNIFWLEFIHRLLGRVIGLEFFVPMVWFVWKRYVPRALLPHLIAMLILGGLQGAIGWLMVQSGLVDRPSVSQYRLALHLGAALLIYVYIIWIALRLIEPHLSPARSGARWASAFAIYVFVVMISGAFVAGLDAGLVHNTFPGMSGYFLPPGAYDPALGFLNHFENQTLVQFQHRILAELAVVLALLLWWRVRKTPRLSHNARLTVNALAVMALIQLGLGIATLLLGVPVTVATLHQAGALILLTLSVLLAHRLRAP